jgi:DNA-binding response OmpR family regulator
VNEKPDLKKKVLIAEDDPISRRLLEAFLTRWGYEVAVVTSGTEALQALEKKDAPRLAVLDWMMPGLEGVQVCQRIRERKDRPYVYILLLSARAQKDDLLHGLESGADDYLTKPFDAQELRARLHVGQRILQLQDGLMVAGEELLFRATHDSLTGISNRAVILDALRRERSMPVAQPMLNLLGPLPPPRLQSGQQFLADGTLHLRHRPATMLTLQQSGQPTGLQCVHPVEKPATADTQLLGNLRSRHLSAGGQARGQQPLLAFHILASPQFVSHRLRQIRPVQVVSFRHFLFCLHPQNSAISN